LTAEVFDRPDCPAWARYAAVDECGSVRLFSDAPWLGASCWNWSNGEVKQLFGVKFDASNWEKSRIKRPEKNTLPKWCKVGEWVYIPQIDEYFRIEKIESILLFNNENHYIDYTYCKQARLRLYNAEEMQGLIGKVLTSNSRSTPFSFLVVYAEGDGSFIESYRFKYTAEELKDHFTIYGKPCGVLEHLENGEWVK
jgi:hypothetical protein